MSLPSANLPLWVIQSYFKRQSYANMDILKDKIIQIVILQRTKLFKYGYFEGQNHLNIHISKDKIIQLWIFRKTKLFKYAYSKGQNSRNIDISE